MSSKPGREGSRILSARRRSLARSMRTRAVESVSMNSKRIVRHLPVENVAAMAALEEGEPARAEHQVVAVTPLERAAAELRKTSNPRLVLTCRALRPSERAAFCFIADSTNKTARSGNERRRRAAGVSARSQEGAPSRELQ